MESVEQPCERQPFNELRGLQHFQTGGTYSDKRDENEMPRPNRFTKGIYTKKHHAYQAELPSRLDTLPQLGQSWQPAQALSLPRLPAER